MQVAVFDSLAVAQAVPQICRKIQTRNCNYLRAYVTPKMPT